MPDGCGVCLRHNIAIEALKGTSYTGMRAMLQRNLKRHIKAKHKGTPVSPFITKAELADKDVEVPVSQIPITDEPSPVKPEPEKPAPEQPKPEPKIESVNDRLAALKKSVRG